MRSLFLLLALGASILVGPATAESPQAWQECAWLDSFTWVCWQCVQPVSLAEGVCVPRHVYWVAQ